MMDGQAAEPVVEVRPEVRVFRDALEFIKEEYDMLAHVIDLLEKLVEFERVQPLALLKVPQQCGTSGSGHCRRIISKRRRHNCSGPIVSSTICRST